MPKIVVQTIVTETMNTPAAVKTGRLLAASHSNIGNSSAPGTTVCQGSFGSKMITAVVAARSARTKKLSMSTWPRGGSRTAAAIPIKTDAMARMPRASDANQCSQVASIGVLGL